MCTATRSRLPVPLPSHHDGPHPSWKKNAASETGADIQPERVGPSQLRLPGRHLLDETVQLLLGRHDRLLALYDDPQREYRLVDDRRLDCQPYEHHGRALPQSGSLDLDEKVAAEVDDLLRHGVRLDRRIPVSFYILSRCRLHSSMVRALVLKTMGREFDPQWGLQFSSAFAAILEYDRLNIFQLTYLLTSVHIDCNLSSYRV